MSKNKSGAERDADKQAPRSGTSEQAPRSGTSEQAPRSGTLGTYKEGTMFRKGTKLPNFSMVFIMRWGGLGDCVHRMVPLFYLYENAPHMSMYVFVYDYLYDLFCHMFKDMRDRVHLMPISAYEGWIERDWCKKLPYVDFKPVQVSASKTHLTQYAYLEMLKRIPQPGRLWNIPQADLTNVDVSKYNLPVSYGILTTGATSPVREWPPQQTLEVARWMTLNKITPVYLGKKSNDLGRVEGQQKSLEAKFSEKAIHAKGVDLRDKTTLLEALKIIEGAKFIAGVDNGLLNLAYMTQTPVVAGYTTIRPIDRVPYRNDVQFDKTIVVEPDRDLECSFCETKQPFVVKEIQGRFSPHDYKHCIYGDKKCTKQMTAGKFIRAIKQILSFEVTSRYQL